MKKDLFKNFLYVLLHVVIATTGFAEFKLCDTGHWIIAIIVAAILLAINKTIADNESVSKLIIAIPILQLFGMAINLIWLALWPQDFADFNSNAAFVAIFSMLLTILVQCFAIADDWD